MNHHWCIVSNGLNPGGLYELKYIKFVKHRARSNNGTAQTIALVSSEGFYEPVHMCAGSSELSLLDYKGMEVEVGSNQKLDV